MSTDRAQFLAERRKGTKEWRPILDNKYEVSNSGEIRRLAGGPGAQPGRRLRPTINRYGYVQQKVYVGHRPKTFTIHVLVALAWHGPRPEGMEINHKNGIKTDNRPENLEYVTMQENKAHGSRLGLLPHGERNGRAKLTEDQVREIRHMNSNGIGQNRLAQMFGVSKFNIYSIVHHHTWRSINDSDSATA